MAYKSQFALMRRKAEDEGITLAEVKKLYRQRLDRLYATTTALSLPVQQFRAENETWIYFCNCAITNRAVESILTSKRARRSFPWY